LRIKFKKGVPPDAMLGALSEYLQDKIIGSVSVYIQEYDDDMKPIKFDDKYIQYDATDLGKEEYGNYVAGQRRKRIKAV
jgi:hypothetical protein